MRPGASSAHPGVVVSAETEQSAAPSSPAEPRRAVGADGRVRAALAATLNALGAVRVYDLDHVASKASIKFAADAWNACGSSLHARVTAQEGCVAHRNLTSEVATDELVDDADHREFCAFLHDRSLAGFEIKAGVSVAELTGLLKLMVCDRPPMLGPALAAAAVSAGIHSIRLLVLSSTGLQFNAGSGAELNVSALVESALGDLCTPRSTGDPRRIADALNNVLSAAGPASIPAIHRSLANAAGYASKSAPNGSGPGESSLSPTCPTEKEQSETSRQRIRDAIALLRPDVRSALFSMAGTSPGEQVASAAWLVDFIDDRSATTIVEALRAADESGEPITPASLLMLSKLTRQAKLVGAAHAEAHALSGRLFARAARDGGVSASIAELLSTANVESFCPADYAQLLQEAARRAGGAARDSRYSRAMGDGSLDMRGFEVAAALIASRSRGEVDSASALGLLAAGVPALAKARRLDLLWTVVEAVHSTASTDSPVWQQARAHALQQLEVPEPLSTLIDDANVRDRLEPGRGQYLASCLNTLFGPRLRPMIMDWLVAVSPPSHAAQWRGLLRAASPSEICRLVSDRLADGPSMDVLASIIRDFAGSQAISVLEPWLEHDSPRVRARGLELAAQIAPKWPSRLAMSALASNQPDIVRACLDRVGAGRADLAPEVLVRFLDGSLRGGPLGELPDPELFDLAAQCLLRSSGVGPAHAAGLLIRLCPGLDLNRARACRRLALLLRPHAQQQVVKEALGFWRGSPACWLAMVLPARGTARASKRSAAA
jgi:hypothetical protein